MQIRNCGTVGGSIAHADAAAEYPAVALALDAEMEVLSTTGRRTVPSPDVFTGLWSTAVGDDELLTAVRFPVWRGRCGFAIREFARRHGDFASAGAAVAVALAGDDRVRCGTIALFGLGPSAQRSAPAEAALGGAAVDGVDADELGQVAVALLDAVPSDLHGSSASGFVVTVEAFLRDNPDPTDDQIREAVSGNLCRCTGYQGILAALRAAADAANA